MKNSTSNAFLGFLAGAAAGAVVGILYAPDKGSQTRKNIKKEAERLSSHVYENMDDQIDNMKRQVNDSVDDLKSKMSELEKEIREQGVIIQKEVASKIEDKARKIKKQA